MESRNLESWYSGAPIIETTSRTEFTLFVDFNKTVDFTRDAAIRNQFSQCFQSKVFFSNVTSK